MWFVYVIYSRSIDKYYIGQTADIQRRLEQHNSHFYKYSATTQADDWILFHIIECESRRQAIQIEKHVKSAKSRKYLSDLKKYPEIGKKLLEK